MHGKDEEVKENENYNLPEWLSIKPQIIIYDTGSDIHLLHPPSVILWTRLTTDEEWREWQQDNNRDLLDNS